MHRTVYIAALVTVFLINCFIFSCIVLSYFLFPEVEISPLLYYLGVVAILISTWAEALLLHRLINKNNIPHVFSIVDISVSVVFFVLYFFALLYVVNLNIKEMLIVLLFGIVFLSSLLLKFKLL